MFGIEAKRRALSPQIEYGWVAKSASHCQVDRVLYVDLSSINLLPVKLLMSCVGR